MSARQRTLRFMSITIPSHLTDDDLMTAVARLSGDERQVVARLVAHLAEVEARELYVPAGYSSLFVYCHEGLGHSEDAAYNRKTAAQVARRYPVVVEMLADGRLTLTAVRLLASALNDDNWRDVFAEAAGKSKDEVKKLAARLDPKPDVPSTVRKLPAPVPAVPERRGEGAEVKRIPGQESAAPMVNVARPDPKGPRGAARVRAPKRPEVAPLAPERYRVQFTIGEETEKKLRRLQQLLRREIPNGDPAVIFDRAVTLLLAKVEARKLGRTARPRKPCALKPGSRHVPAETRREVVPRDGERCTFVAGDGRRCTERVYLEFHHAGIPFAHGGGPGPANVALHCRVHNAFEGKRIFGDHLPKEIREARDRYDAMRFPVPERRAKQEPSS